MIKIAVVILLLSVFYSCSNKEQFLVYPADQVLDEDNFYNIGFQLDTRHVMFSLLAATLSVGWAKAYDLDDSSLTYDEWMVSLKF